MSALTRVLLLAGVLVAPASFAQILGNQTGIMGGESGFFDPGVRSPLAIAALPYARTVTCTGAITLTGTAIGAGAVSWAASPDGASGACTGTTSWSCDVSVSPNAAGEGVETITVTQGANTKSVDVGFYVAGAHSCFLAQSINGTYNSGLVDADAVGTWVNLGSSAKNVTQATGSAQPSLRTAVVGGQPVVRCDGGDQLAAATASDWTFLHDGTGASIETISKSTLSTVQTMVATSTGSGTNTGIMHRRNTTFAAQFFLSDGVTAKINTSSATNVLVDGKFSLYASTLASADTPDLTGYANGTSVLTADAAAFSALAPANPVSICSTPAAALPVTGDLFRVMFYTASLTSTQRGINVAVDEWALGGTLPVTP
jgi:hypothetical protein